MSGAGIEKRGSAATVRVSCPAVRSSSWCFSLVGLRLAVVVGLAFSRIFQHAIAQTSNNAVFDSTETYTKT